MKIVGQLKAILGLDKKKFDSGLKGAKKSTGNFAATAKKLFAGLGIAVAAKKIFDFAKSSVNAANTQMQAEASLRQQIIANGKAVEATMAKYKAFASGLQKVTTVGDETTLHLLQMAETMKSKAPQEAAKGAIALSKSLGIDLQSALKMVTLAQNGEYTMLNRYIPALRAASTEAEKHAILQKTLADGFKIAKEQAKTGLGPIEQLKNAWGDIKEKIGGALMPALAKVANWFLSVLPGLGKGFGNIKKGIVSVINYFIDLYNESTAFRVIIQYIGFTFKTIFQAIKVQIQSVINIFSTLGKVVKAVLTGKFKEIPGILKDSFASQKDIIIAAGKETAENFQKGIENVVKKKHVQLIGEGTKTKAVKDAYALGLKAAAAFARGKAKEMAGGRVAGVKVEGTDTSQLADMSGVMQRNIELTDKMKGGLLDMANITPIIGNLFEGMSNSISDALNSSQNVFKAFFKFFGNFIKGLIIKLVAATVAALAFAAVLSFILPGLGLGKIAEKMGKAATFGKTFGKMFTGMAGIAKFASGGIVPAGYPGDTYPALLSSGETVLPKNFNVGTGKVVFEIGDDKLIGILERAQNKRNSW